MELRWEIEKASPREGIIQLVVFQGRPAGSRKGDRDDEGLDPESAAKAVQQWTADFGREIDYYNPKTRRIEPRFNGLYDTHREPIAADLLASWYFADEQKARIIVRPHDPRYAEMAEKGQITGASWKGSVTVELVEEEDD